MCASMKMLGCPSSHLRDRTGARRAGEERGCFTGEVNLDPKAQ